MDEHSCESDSCKRLKEYISNSFIEAFDKKSVFKPIDDEHFGQFKVLSANVFNFNILPFSAHIRDVESVYATTLFLCTICGLISQHQGGQIKRCICLYSIPSMPITAWVMKLNLISAGWRPVQALFCIIFHICEEVLECLTVQVKIWLRKVVNTSYFAEMPLSKTIALS